MATLKDEADALRLGLITGLVDADQIVAWADRLIAEDRITEVPVALDLSVSRERRVADLVSLLSTVPGETDVRTVGRRIAGRLYRLLANAEVDIIRAARAMCTLLREGYAPDDEFENMAYFADDGVDLAVAGTYGTLSEVQSEVAAFLQRYSTDADALVPPAA